MKKYLLLIISFFCFNLQAKLTEQKWQKLTRFVDEARYTEQIYILTGQQSYRPRVGQGFDPLPDRAAPESMDRVRRYFLDQFYGAGYRVVYFEKFKYPFWKSGLYPARDRRGRNFFVEIPGAETPNEVVMLGAHYDTRGVDTPGADDNASGTAAVLSVARAFKESGIVPKRTLRFVLFDAEEFPGAMAGSAIHLNNVLRRKEELRLFVNLDMIAFSPTGENNLLYDPGQFRQIKKLLEQVNDESPVNFGLEAWSPHGSDQISGYERGIPAVSIFENPTREGEYISDYPYYHTVEDTVDKVNLAYATRLSRYIASVLAVAANSTETWEEPDSQKLQRWRRFVAPFSNLIRGARQGFKKRPCSYSLIE